MKKVFYLLCTLTICFMLTGCGEKNIEGSLTEIMDKLYDGIKEEELPMMVDNIELNDENFEYYAFVRC